MEGAGVNNPFRPRNIVGGAAPDARGGRRNPLSPLLYLVVFSAVVTFFYDEALFRRSKYHFKAGAEWDETANAFRPSAEQMKEARKLNLEDRLLATTKNAWPECRAQQLTAIQCKDFIDQEIFTLFTDQDKFIRTRIVGGRTLEDDWYNAVSIIMDDNNIVLGQDGTGWITYTFAWDGSGTEATTEQQQAIPPVTAQETASGSAEGETVTTILTPDPMDAFDPIVVPETPASAPATEPESPATSATLPPPVVETTVVVTTGTTTTIETTTAPPFTATFQPIATGAPPLTGGVIPVQTTVAATQAPPAGDSFDFDQLPVVPQNDGPILVEGASTDGAIAGDETEPINGGVILNDGTSTPGGEGEIRLQQILNQPPTIWPAGAREVGPFDCRYMNGFQCCLAIKHLVRDADINGKAIQCHLDYEETTCSKKWWIVEETGKKVLIYTNENEMVLEDPVITGSWPQCDEVWTDERNWADGGGGGGGGANPIPPTPPPTPSPPTNGPTTSPSPGPTNGPTNGPTPYPTPNPTSGPTNGPTPYPTGGPSAGPTNGPTPYPTPNPTGGPTTSPSPGPTGGPTAGPTPFPTNSPSKGPTAGPTPFPTNSPSKGPTPFPTNSPSAGPTAGPTPFPTNSPSKGPTPFPTNSPSTSPTPGPTTSPSPGPSKSPTPQPTNGPTAGPTPFPTNSPSKGPTPFPTPFPTNSPSTSPTPKPSAGPTAGPTPHPTGGPTTGPTAGPTPWPTPYPTGGPTTGPTAGPTPWPTPYPTGGPTTGPTAGPTPWPTPNPTSGPTATNGQPYCDFGSDGTGATATCDGLGGAVWCDEAEANCDSCNGLWCTPGGSPGGSSTGSPTAGPTPWPTPNPTSGPTPTTNEQPYCDFGPDGTAATATCDGTGGVGSCDASEENCDGCDGLWCIQGIGGGSPGGGGSAGWGGGDNLNEADGQCTPVGVGQRCGADFNNLPCCDGYCCSAWGWCGTGAAWCDFGCQTNCWANSDTTGLTVQERCGDAAGGKLCHGTYCCSAAGYCGSGEIYCEADQGCQSGCWPVEGDGTAAMEDIPDTIATECRGSVNICIAMDTSGSVCSPDFDDPQTCYDCAGSCQQGGHDKNTCCPNFDTIQDFGISVINWINHLQFGVNRNSFSLVTFANLGFTASNIGDDVLARIPTLDYSGGLTNHGNGIDTCQATFSGHEGQNYILLVTDGVATTNDGTNWNPANGESHGRARADAAKAQGTIIDTVYINPKLASTAEETYMNYLSSSGSFHDIDDFAILGTEVNDVAYKLACSGDTEVPPHVPENVENVSEHCGTPTCTDTVWATHTGTWGNWWTCGERVEWMQEYPQSLSYEAACAHVTNEYPTGCPCN